MSKNGPEETITGVVCDTNQRGVYLHVTGEHGPRWLNWSKYCENPLSDLEEGQHVTMTVRGDWIFTAAVAKRKRDTARAVALAPPRPAAPARDRSDNIDRSVALKAAIESQIKLGEGSLTGILCLAEGYLCWLRGSSVREAREAAYGEMGKSREEEVQPPLQLDPSDPWAED